MRNIIIGTYGNFNPDKVSPIVVPGVLSTGKTDRDGRPVYEGDIIQDYEGDQYVVFWNDDHCGLFKKPVDGGGGYTGLNSLHFYEVIKSEVAYQDGVE